MPRARAPRPPIHGAPAHRTNTPTTAPIAKVTAAGVKLRNQPMVFHDRKLVFLEGPDGIVVELAQWA